jgi:glycosyltransferase involved in cell wall biosynthesis
MRICLVAQEYPPVTAVGGIGSQTWNKAHGLAAQGHDVEVLSCGHAGWPDLDTRVEDGIVVHRMAPPGEERAHAFPIHDEALYALAYSVGVARWLHHISADKPFDVIDAPEYGAELYAYQLNRSSWYGSPVVVQLHGPLAMFADHIGWPLPETSLHRVGTAMERESIQRADAVMACSANIADYAAAWGARDRADIEVVHCGVDDTAFQPARATGGRPTVLFVGNVEANKGVVTAFDAMLRLRDEFPDVLLIVAGSGSLGAELQDRAATEGASANVEFAGFVSDRGALPALYQRADVFCSPAQHEVGVANVYLEAMASGLPVVASNTGAAPEAVDDGSSGFLVPPTDPSATAAALAQLLRGTDLRRRMGEEGRRRVDDYFASRHYLDRVLNVYELAIERHTQATSTDHEPVVSR